LLKVRYNKTSETNLIGDYIMNVAELKKYLEEFDDDSEVVFSHPSHDYWKTTMASSICTLKMGIVEYSDYHRQNVLKDTEEEFEEEEFDSEKNGTSSRHFLIK
jgi:hypothetical protein